MRNSQKGKIPYSVVVGDSEVESFPSGPALEGDGFVTVRKYGEKGDSTLSLSDLFDVFEQ